ncbi:hypothetical protein LTR78_003148 [Recurvomyces mirabilis]|uniref:Uncharacterized protein n=1 Tax=Recurvomyces mirabilis TaxID=574656 RepID=A0AAE0WSC6_9PEZI|nr:hypothetical protein LTR78_003148 [Recurvomyces mirabilis]KAK5157031.1 hypothetical protein LTS14_004548 [Recurvomyces mirabilis]
MSSRANGCNEDDIMASRKAIRRRVQADAVDHKQTAAVAVSEALPAWNLDHQPEEVQEALLGLEVLWREKDKRIKLLQRLSNPWPEDQQSGIHKDRAPAPSSPSPPKSHLPESTAAPISHPTFRHLLLTSPNDKTTRQILRAQLLRCRTPYDIKLILALCFTLTPRLKTHIAALHEPLVRALYRCRAQVPDTAVLSLLNAMRARYAVHEVPFNTQLLALGLKFAARTRSLADMKKYLRALSRDRRDVTSNVFRATIAKFSIGHRGLGEIRNGRWKRHELLQVLTGFHDCAQLPPKQQFHLGTFLDRSDWQYLHGWIAALARCRDAEAVWREWQLWKLSEGRRRPKVLNVPQRVVTTRSRGDYWFVEQMAYAGGVGYAWRIVEEIDMGFGRMKERIKTRLLEGLEFCPAEYFSVHRDAIREALLRKCETDLSLIEKAMSVSWIPTDLDDEAQGYHVLFEEQEAVLERLGEEGWKVEEDFGFPYEGEGIVPVRERGLHDAGVVEEGEGEG